MSDETNTLHNFIHFYKAANRQIEKYFKRTIDVEKMKSLKYVICVLR